MRRERIKSQGDVSIYRETSGQKFKFPVFSVATYEGGFFSGKPESAEEELYEEDVDGALIGVNGALCGETPQERTCLSDGNLGSSVEQEVSAQNVHALGKTG